MKITVGIPTKNRYNILSHCLLSVAFQTLKPHEVIIVDDSDTTKDIRNIPEYDYILKLLDDKKISWKVIFGRKKGQHYSHQLVQEISESDWIFRLDDDCVMEPDCLEKLSKHISDNVGGIAPVVLLPNPADLPPGLSNTIDTISLPNVQWFKSKEIQNAQHLYSCFLYKKGIAKYDLSLSNKAHREETIFSHLIFRKGYDLIIEPNAICHHFRMNSGGIRTDQNIEDYENDERIFSSYLEEWKVENNTKWVILDSGLGDHWAFKHCLKDLKQKYSKIRIACCYPDVFWDEPEVELFSIAEAKLLFSNIDRFNIYRFMIENNWKGELKDAFKKMYL